MIELLLPRDCPVVIAAAVAGLSAATFKARCLDTGAVKTEAGRVLLASLAAHFGKPIDTSTYLRAERSRDARRERQRLYAKRKRAEQRRAA